MVSKSKQQGYQVTAYSPTRTKFLPSYPECIATFRGKWMREWSDHDSQPAAWSDSTGTQYGFA